MTFLPPGTRTVLYAEVGPGALAGVNVQTQAAFMLPVSGDPAQTPAHLRISYDGKRFLPALPAVPPGPVVAEVDNTGLARGALLLINWPPELASLTTKPALDFDPYISGRALLACQPFRGLFRSERIEDNEGLGIRQITFLFT